MIMLFGFSRRHKKIEVYSPVNGTIVDLSEVSDPIFSQRMVGDGTAVNPRDGLIVSPVNGEVIQIFPTLHAVGLKTEEGLEVLIHIGIDTVELKGEGFKALIKQGDRVSVGTPLIQVDLDRVKASGRSVLTPVILTNGDVIQSIEKKSGDVRAGMDSIMTVTMK